LRVAFDAGPWLGTRTGVGRYARELATALGTLGHDLVPFAVALRGSHGGIRRWRVPARLAQDAWRRFGGPAITRLTGPVDVVHGTNFVLPATGSVPGVVTIHDLSWLRDDAFPGAHRLRALVPWSVRRAGAVLVPSEAVGLELSNSLQVPPGKVHVSPEGVAPHFFGATPLGGAALGALGIRPPFALAVGTVEPRKNLARLLEAWAGVRGRMDGWSLVIAGPSGWGPQLPEAPGVVPIGWVGDETLPGLLAAADAFCYPSLYEGFGLPPLEAMAAGTACVVGAYPAAAEVVGDAAVVVDPQDVDAIADGLLAVATEGQLRARLAVAGRARAARYTWERTARATSDAYRSVIEE
jgi:glycosyltransferase involved in cell wall biosynthesis